MNLLGNRKSQPLQSKLILLFLISRGKIGGVIVQAVKQTRCPNCSSPMKLTINQEKSSGVCKNCNSLIVEQRTINELVIRVINQFKKNK